MVPVPLDRRDQVPNMLRGRLWVYMCSVQLFPNQTRSEPHEGLRVLVRLGIVVRVPFLEMCWEIFYPFEIVGQKLCHHVQIALCFQRSMPVVAERTVVTDDAK
jgi:hypothetical protein